MHEKRPSVAAVLGPVFWPLVAWGVLLAFNALLTPGFFALEWRDGRVFGTPVDVLNHGSRVAIVAIGMALVIATRGVDLSVGAVAAISGAVTATLVREVQVPAAGAIAAALLVALLCGLWNGVLVAWLRLQPIVATLVLMVAGRGIAQLTTSGLIVTFEEPRIAAIANGAVLGLPVTVWMLAAVGLLSWLATHRTSLGLFVAAVGANPEASRLAGVPERRVKLIAYAVCGLLAGVAGLIECSYIKAADANNAGNLLELDAILAVVVGGTSLAGGRFTLVGTVIGAMVMQTLTQTLYMQNVGADMAPAPKAAAVIVVALLQTGGLGGAARQLRRASAGGTR